MAVTMESEEKACDHEKFDREVRKGWESTRPAFREFRGIHSADKIGKDKRYLDQRKEQFERKTESARNLELSVAEGIGSYDWFGGETDVILTNEYDDVRNGVDMVLNFYRADDSSIKIGVDVTTSQSSHELREKILRTADGLEQGRIPRVDYYKQEGDNETGIVYLPRVVVGTDDINADKLYKDFCQVLEDKKGKGGEMAENNFQRKLLRQIERQLAYYTEKSLVPFDKFHGRENKKELTEMRKALTSLKDIKLVDKVDSEEFKNLLKFLEDSQEEIFALDPKLAGHLYKHTEALKLIQEIDQEKSSQGIESPGASNPTEEKLELAKLLVS